MVGRRPGPKTRPAAAAHTVQATGMRVERGLARAHACVDNSSSICVCARLTLLRSGCAAAPAWPPPAAAATSSRSEKSRAGVSTCSRCCRARTPLGAAHPAHLQLPAWPGPLRGGSCCQTRCLREQRRIRALAQLRGCDSPGKKNSPAAATLDASPSTAPLNISRWRCCGTPVVASIRALRCAMGVCAAAMACMRRFLRHAARRRPVLGAPCTHVSLHIERVHRLVQQLHSHGHLCHAGCCVVRAHCCRVVRAHCCRRSCFLCRGCSM